MNLQVLYRRLLIAAFFLGVVTIVGTAGYYVIGDGRWTRFECFYMAVITLSTVGFGETLTGMAQVPAARGLTLLLILAGSAVLLSFVSTLTALIVEGDLQGLLRNRRMNNALKKLSDHLIVCGVGTTGRHIARRAHGVGRALRDHRLRPGAHRRHGAAARG